jgi:MFS family permease
MTPTPTETRSACPANPAAMVEGCDDGPGIGAVSAELGDAKRQFWTVVGSHVVVDIYPIFFAALQISLADHLKLTGWQIAVIYASNQILSGLPQSLAAWLSDRYDTRIAGPLGLTMSCVCSCLIGFAPNFWVLWLLLSVAMVGNGIYHPIAGAQAGQLGGRVLSHGRALAVSLFFAAGMVGSVIGPIASTRMNARFGLTSLVWLIPLGLVTAFILHRVTAHVSHRDRRHAAVVASIPPEEARLRWNAVWMLYAGNALRFIVNTAMYILFNIWAARAIPNDPAAATLLNGNLVVAMTIGMGVGAIAAGRIIKPGSERRAIFVLSVFGAVFTAMTSYAGHHWGMWPMYVCAALTSLGFSSILPITIGLAQRLLPHRTGLASSLMMGGSWAIAAVAPLIVGLFLGPPVPAGGVSIERLDWAFVGFGAILLLAGGLATLMPGEIIRKVGGAK